MAGDGPGPRAEDCTPTPDLHGRAGRRLHPDGAALSQPQRSERLRAAVLARREELIGLTQALVRERSLLGEEEGAQRLIADRLAGLGFEMAEIAVDPGVGQDDPTWGYPPAAYEGRTCVAGRIEGSGEGRSLHLSGHIDVVPVESASDWEHDPWGAEISEGCIWGRGAGDMKAGLAAYLIGTAALLEVCGPPPGDLIFSSVIEEECTGNGMKAVLAAGYEAEGTLIGEPSALQLMHAGVGVIWARLTAHSGGAHPGFSTGTSSSAALLRAVDGLRDLERRINQRPAAGPGPAAPDGDTVFLRAHEHPFRLNVGTLSGGVWPSSEPARAEARVRLGFGRETTPGEAQRRVAEAVRAAAPEVEVGFEGFRAPAYCDDLDHGLARALIDAHELLHGSPPPRQVLPATTDARSISGPCICYGPLAGAIHGTDEWVDIESIEAVAAAIALTIADWQDEPRTPA